ncbi:MAG: DNA polymerase III subunit alpha, partial [Chloroflexi bacterium]|nr:DNA polymerase III subunit alpha [Chloroflexota bacterium]
IDLDFADDRRDEVIQYVVEKYGRDRVAQIITFGTLGAKAAIRDVGRALGLPYSDVDRVARLVPAALHMTLDRALEESPELAEMVRLDDQTRHLVETAKPLEGIARHASTHAAGVVISSEPLAELVPLQRPSRATDENAVLTTQFPMGDVARIGLLKMDFLGLTNLTILAKARDRITQTRGVELDLLDLPWDDARTYQMLAEGNTTAVFQLESAGMRKYIKELKPSSLGDLAAMVALYRPGPMQHIPTFINAKHGIEPVQFPHPALAEILSDTYGVIVYQDQVLLILRHFAGYSLGQADIVRKAMGKKNRELMEAEKQNFLAGAQAKGFTLEAAEAVFALIEPFAGYAFNKAHATSYALIAYQTAYLKANYPAEYMAAVLTCAMTAADKLAALVAECTRLGVPVLPPDINRSGLEFTVERARDGSGEPASEPKLAVRFGLAAVKNVGASALEPVLATREEGGPFTSIEDVCRRADLHALNKRAVESLIKAGAFDALGKRGALLANVDRLVSMAQRERQLRESGQSTLFDLWGERVEAPLPSLDIPTDQDAPLQEKLAWEKELLGVYVSEHPFASVAAQAARETTALCGEVTEEMAGQQVAVAGMVASVRQLTTKDRRPFVAATLEDLVGTLEITAWPEVYERTRDLWQEGTLLLVRGKVQVRGGGVQLTCDHARRYAPDAQASAQPLLEEPGPDVFEHASPELYDAPLPASEAVTVAKRKAPVFYPNGTNGNAGGALGSPAGNGNGRKASESGKRENGAIPRSSPAEPPRTLVVRLSETSDVDGDIARFLEAVRILRRFEGRDRVCLRIHSAQGMVHLEIADLTTHYGPDLHGELVRLLGEDGLLLREDSA